VLKVNFTRAILKSLKKLMKMWIGTKRSSFIGYNGKTDRVSAGWDCADANSLYPKLGFIFLISKIKR